MTLPRAPKRYRRAHVYTKRNGWASTWLTVTLISFTSKTLSSSPSQSASLGRYPRSVFVCPPMDKYAGQGSINIAQVTRHYTGLRESQKQPLPGPHAGCRIGSHHLIVLFPLPRLASITHSHVAFPPSRTRRLGRHRGQNLQIPRTPRWNAHRFQRKLQGPRQPELRYFTT